MLPKIISLFCLFLALSFLVVPVSASEQRIANGGFETGNLQGWNTSGGYIEVLSGSWAQHSGIYSVRIYPMIGTVSILSQNVDLTGVSEISFYGCGYFGSGGYVLIGNDVVKNIPNTYPSWQYYTIDVSSYTGIHTLKFCADLNNYVLIDSVSAFGTPAPTNNLYFDGQTTNRNYYLNDTYSNLGLYEKELIEYEIGDYDPNKIYFINETRTGWQKDINSASNLDMDAFQKVNSWMSPNLYYVDNSTVYTFNLYQVDGVQKSNIPWYMIFIQPISYLINYFSDGTPVYTKLDTLTVTLNLVNSTVYNVPSSPDLSEPYENTTLENPFENLTDVIENEIPNLPVGDNTTVDQSGLSDYYNSTQSAVSDFHETGSRGIGVITAPLESASNSIDGLNQVSTSVFTRVTGLFSPVLVVLGAFFGVMPDELITVGSFLLICLGVLMVVRRTE